MANVMKNFVGKIVDTRVVESVKLFTGQESEWRQWSIDFKSAVTNFGLDEVMDTCEQISESECLRINCDDKNRLLSKALYICLANRIKTGKAREILDKPGRLSEGYLCWKLLKNEYEKDDPGRYNAMLQALLNPQFEQAMRQHGKPFGELMAVWENAVERYRQQSRQPFTENMMVATVSKHGTADIRHLLRINALVIGTSWSKAKEMIQSYTLCGLEFDALGQVTTKAIADAGPVPMDIGGLHDEGMLTGDIGYFGKKGKKGAGKYGKYGKGKDKKGKDKSGKDRRAKGKKGDGKGNKDKSSEGKGKTEYFAGYCGYCWKKGHKRKDCRKRLADMAAKNGGGNGEHRRACRFKTFFGQMLKRP